MGRGLPKSSETPNAEEKANHAEEIIVKHNLCRVSAFLAILLLGIASAIAADSTRETLIVTSTNDAANNAVLVFRFNPAAATLTFVDEVPTGGQGGASGNAGVVQFKGTFGAVVNFGSNSLTRLIREGNSIQSNGTIALASGCTQPDSVALDHHQAYVLGANCAETHSWPQGSVSGTVSLSDASGAQIVAGETWAAVTLKSGSVLQLPVSANGSLTGTSSPVSLPSDANNTPLGAAFWGNLLGFNPAHSPDSFALVDSRANVFPILGPQPAYPSNAPCWLAKGAGNIWYAGNSPGQAISIFFTDGQGGTFYKSVPVAGVPTDLTVSPDGKWLAVIYTAADGSGARVAVFAIDRYGDLSLRATSVPVGVTSFNGVAISQ